MAVLKRAAQRDMPSLITRLFSDRLAAAKHRQIEHFDGVTEATIASISEDKDGETRPFPVQVDGDYIGEQTKVELKAVPRRPDRCVRREREASGGSGVMR